MNEHHDPQKNADRDRVIARGSAAGRWAQVNEETQKSDPPEQTDQTLSDLQSLQQLAGFTPPGMTPTEFDQAIRDERSK